MDTVEHGSLYNRTTEPKQSTWVQLHYKNSTKLETLLDTHNPVHLISISTLDNVDFLLNTLFDIPTGFRLIRVLSFIARKISRLLIADRFLQTTLWLVEF